MTVRERPIYNDDFTDIEVQMGLVLTGSLEAGVKFELLPKLRGRLDIDLKAYGIASVSGEVKYIEDVAGKGKDNRVEFEFNIDPFVIGMSLVAEAKGGVFDFTLVNYQKERHLFKRVEWKGVKPYNQKL